MSRLIRSALLAIPLLVSGCQANQPADLQTGPASVPALELTATLIEEIIPPLPTAVLLPEQVSWEGADPVQQPVPSPVSDPLRFVFPTPGPVPVSAWRPPLYPTPWASRPIAADEINWPLADYRYGGMFLPSVIHTGIDIPIKVGTPVLAAGSGRVTWAGYGLYQGDDDPTDPYGLAIVIKHDFGFQGETLYTVYGHLDRIDVIVGQYVTAGEMLGISGDTGKVTGQGNHENEEGDRSPRPAPDVRSQANQKHTQNACKKRDPFDRHGPNVKAHYSQRDSEHDKANAEHPTRFGLLALIEL